MANLAAPPKTGTHYAHRYRQQHSTQQAGVSTLTQPCQIKKPAGRPSAKTTRLTGVSVGPKVTKTVGGTRPATPADLTAIGRMGIETVTPVVPETADADDTRCPTWMVGRAAFVHEGPRGVPGPDTGLTPRLNKRCRRRAGLPRHAARFQPRSTFSRPPLLDLVNLEPALLPTAPPSSPPTKQARSLALDPLGPPGAGDTTTGQTFGYLVVAERGVSDRRGARGVVQVTRSPDPPWKQGPKRFRLSQQRPYPPGRAILVVRGKRMKQGGGNGRRSPIKRFLRRRNHHDCSDCRNETGAHSGTLSITGRVSCSNRSRRLGSGPTRRSGGAP